MKWGGVGWGGGGDRLVIGEREGRRLRGGLGDLGGNLRAGLQGK